jgi:hypothetical protein
MIDMGGCARSIKRAFKGLIGLPGNTSGFALHRRECCPKAAAHIGSLAASAKVELQEG